MFLFTFQRKFKTPCNFSEGTEDYYVISSFDYMFRVCPHYHFVPSIQFIFNGDKKKTSHIALFMAVILNKHNKTTSNKMVYFSTFYIL